MEVLIFVVLVILLLGTIYYASKDINNAKSENGLFNYRKGQINYRAEVKDVKTNVVRSGDKKSFDITVIFDDTFVYKRNIKPTNVVNGVSGISRNDVEKITEEAKEAHFKVCRELGLAPSYEQMQKTAANLEFLGNMQKLNNKFFPGGIENKQICAKQIDILTGHKLETKECLDIFIYCVTQYSVNSSDYRYVIKHLPIAHPLLKDEEAIKKIATYTFFYTVKDFKLPFDLTNPKDMNLLNTITKELDIQSYAREVNFNKYDEDSGLIRKKPLFFHGFENAEEYLNSLYDESGNKLKVGSRYSYSEENIPGMLDCYTMCYEDGREYGELYVSSYGADDCTFVPKGYKHKLLSNNRKQESSKTYASTNQSNTKPNANSVENDKTANLSKTDLNSNEGNKRSASKTEIKSTPDDEINFCRKCGAKLKPDSIYCEKCGSKVR